MRLTHVLFQHKEGGKQRLRLTRTLSHKEGGIPRLRLPGAHSLEIPAQRRWEAESETDTCTLSHKEGGKQRLRLGPFSRDTSTRRVGSRD